MSDETTVRMKDREHFLKHKDHRAKATPLDLGLIHTRLGPCRVGGMEMENGDVLPSLTFSSTLFLGDGDPHNSYCTHYSGAVVLGTGRHSLDEHDLYLHPEANTNKHSFSNNPTPPAEPSCFTINTINTVILSLLNIPAHSRQRSLTGNASLFYDEMTSLPSDAPGSPPGLTGSKSSKSSSFHSSSLSGTDGILSDITHFEDIGLDGDHHTSPSVLDGMEKPLRPSPYNTAAMGGTRSSAPSMTTMRDLTNIGNKLPYPTRQTQMKGHVPSHSLSLPNGAGSKRGFRSPSSPSLALQAMSNRNRSRSPSPHTMSPKTRSVISPVAPMGKGLSAPIAMKKPPIRRGSWQPSRKSIKELEAEYNDEDDDLPDDASLWNVPISPRPPTERTSLSASSSPKPSPCTSPERKSPLRAGLGVSTLPPPSTAPPLTASSPLSGNPSSPPISPKKPKVTRGASTGAMPDHFGFPVSRTKSWNVALSELSEDAKSLTEALENQAVIAEQNQEAAMQNGEQHTRPSVERLSRAKTGTVQLPPLRISNVMVDPLPISKEKEKVLSRTRPSWLPPKSQKEEKKHLKEYQRIMELSIEAEKRKAAKAVDTQCAKDDTKSALLRIWEEHVLPNWDQVIREPRTRELWWRGVAPKSRAQVWQRGIGNDLALTDVTFNKALQRAKDTEAQIARYGSEVLAKEKAWFDAIRRDVNVTFPELKIFQPFGPLHHDLVDVLMAYSMYRSDVGYSHGTHLIAALLCLNLSTPSAAFSTLCNLLNRPLPLAFLTGDPAGTAKAYQLTDGLLSHKYPRLHAHLFSAAPAGLGLIAHEVFEPMMRTLFLGPGNGLGVEAVARVWDVMVFDGDSVIIRTAVAVLGALEAKLYGGEDEVLGVVGWGGGRGSGAWDVGMEDDFMSKVRAAGKEEKGRST
ncbi:hypothetical protein MMC21_004687 [Puttea exsequens]|nr:hypothetical protein [Puttea exsequens]